MKQLLLLSLLFSIPLLPLQAQFEICDTPTNQDLYDIFFINPDVGVAVGDSGTILRSIDGGINWDIVMQNDTLAFKKVAFFDEQNGIAVGKGWFRTTDQGVSWNEIENNNFFFYDIAIVNDSVGWVSGYTTGLLKTSDQGQSWDTLIPINDNESFGLLSFINEELGYATRQGGGHTNQILKTTDGGINWDTIFAQSGIDNTVLEAMNFVAEDFGYRAGWYNSHFMRTTDGGFNWDLVTFIDSTNQTTFYEQLYDFHISANQPYSYYACGWYGKIFKSLDLGQNWSILNSPVGNTTTLYGIYFLNDFLGWIVGADGTILKTENGGIITSTNEVSNPSKVALYPNPTAGKFTIQNEANHPIDWMIVLDDSGKRVRYLKDQQEVDLSHLPKGIYTIKISIDESLYVKQIILK